MKNQKAIVTRLSGILGLIGTIVLIFYILLNLVVIFGTPVCDGSGDLYDLRVALSPWELLTEDGVFISVFVTFVVLLPLFPLFYPWLKLFVMMSLRKNRIAYFGLYPASNVLSKIFSVGLAIANITTIVFFAYKSGKESYTILNSDAYADAITDDSWLYWLFMIGIMFFWGGVNLVYTFYNHIKQYESEKA